MGAVKQVEAVFAVPDNPMAVSFLHLLMLERILRQTCSIKPDAHADDCHLHRDVLRMRTVPQRVRCCFFGGVRKTSIPMA